MHYANNTRAANAIRGRTIAEFNRARRIEAANERLAAIARATGRASVFFLVGGAIVLALSIRPYVGF